MWLMTTSGFYSIVKHKTEADCFMVRGRVKGDLENLRMLVGLAQPVIVTPSADYPFRLIVTEAQKTAIITALAARVDYPNFKSEVAKLPAQKKKLHAYHEVWAAMRGVEEPEAREW